MRWHVLALMVALAGCASGPAPPVEPGEAILGEGNPPPLAGPPQLTYDTLAETTFFLAPARQTQVPVTVPNGTLGVSVNLTLAQGAAFGIYAQMGACQWKRDVAFVAEGQEVIIDCGGIFEGAETLALDAQAGALSGTLRVVALVCHARSGCPSRLPVPAP